jgi:hypothetical protein
MDNAVANNAGGQAIERLEQTQPLTDAEKTFIHKHEAAHTTMLQPDANIARDMVINTKLTDDVDVPVNASTPKPELKSISEKAFLFKLSQSKFSTNVKDVDKTNEYGAGSVTKKLFKGDNLVSKARSAHDEVYTYVRDNTLPWDIGLRLLNADFFREFSAEVRRLIAEADKAVEKVVANWDALVQADFRRIEAIGHATNNPTLADLNDYPADIAPFYANSTELIPIAKTASLMKDPRYGVTEADVAAYEQKLEERQKDSGKSVVTNLLKPMEAAIESLSKPVDDVKKFYSSVVTNMTDVCYRMTRASVSDEQYVARSITDLATLAGSFNIDLLKHNQTARADAVVKLTALAAKFKGYL